MQNPSPLLVGGQVDVDKTDEELEQEQDTEDRARAEFIEAWKSMYRRKVDPRTITLTGTLCEDEPGE